MIVAVLKIFTITKNLSSACVVLHLMTTGSLELEAGDYSQIVVYSSIILHWGGKLLNAKTTCPIQSKLGPKFSFPLSICNFDN